jgi:hypothetical protein
MEYPNWEKEQQLRTLMCLKNTRIIRSFFILWDPTRALDESRVKISTK